MDMCAHKSLEQFKRLIKDDDETHWHFRFHLRIRERQLRSALRENKLLKAQSVAPPSLPKQEVTADELIQFLYQDDPEGPFTHKFIQRTIDILKASRASAPVALPTHQLIGRPDLCHSRYAELRCSCGRIFVGLGDEALASSRASFEAHLPEKEGK